MKKLLLSLLISCPALTVASVPNMWHSGWGQGWAEYSISNSKGQTLRIACNEGYDDETPHSVTFEAKNRQISTNNEDWLAFLIDGEAHYVSRDQQTRNGQNAWFGFIESISKGKQIDFYYNSKKVATFKPTRQSIKSVISDIGCSLKN